MYQRNRYVRPSLLTLPLAGLLPLCFSFFWLYQNTQLPVSDPANFLATSVSIYQKFQDQGFWKGLWACYTIRGFRPISFPVFIVPFLLYTHGHLLISYSLVALVSIAATIFYVYLLFRLALNRTAAVIATNIVGLLPMLQAQILGFYAESLLFPCLLGCLYHLIASNYLTERRHTVFFILFFALATTLRPIETGLHLIFVMGAFLYWGKRQRVFNAQQLLQLLVIFISAIALFMIPVIKKLLHHRYVIDKEMFSFIWHISFGVFLVTFCVWVTFLICRSKTKSTDANSNLLWAFGFALLLVLFWFEPFAFRTIEWIYRTSFGDIAQATTPLAHSHVWTALKLKINAEGAMIVWGVIVLALLGYCCQSNMKLAMRSTPIIYLLLMLPLPIIEMFTTVQDIHRKLSVVFPALLMALLIVGLKSGKWWRLRMFFGIQLLLLQCILLVYAQFSHSPYVSWLDQTVGYYVRPPVQTSPNPHQVVADFLMHKAQQLHLHSIGLLVNPNTFEPIDPFLMMTIVQALKVNVKVGYSYFNQFSTNNPQLLAQHEDAVFIADRVDRLVVSSSATENYAERYHIETNPSLKTMYLFLHAYASDTLASLGWRPVDCVVIHNGCLIDPIQKGIRTASCLGCLLLKDVHKK